MVGWAMFPAAEVSVEGEPKVYSSSANGRRSFCVACGTGLFFTNAALDRMGMVQVRIAALDDPAAIAPKMRVQMVERIDWLATLQSLPAFDRFPE